MATQSGRPRSWGVWSLESGCIGCVECVGCVGCVGCPGCVGCIGRIGCTGCRAEGSRASGSGAYRFCGKGQTGLQGPHTAMTHGGNEIGSMWSAAEPAPPGCIIRGSARRRRRAWEGEAEGEGGRRGERGAGRDALNRMSCGNPVSGFPRTLIGLNVNFCLAPRRPRPRYALGHGQTCDMQSPSQPVTAGAQE